MRHAIWLMPYALCLMHFAFCHMHFTFYALLPPCPRVSPQMAQWLILWISIQLLFPRWSEVTIVDDQFHLLSILLCGWMQITPQKNLFHLQIFYISLRLFIHVELYFVVFFGRVHLIDSCHCFRPHWFFFVSPASTRPSLFLESDSQYKRTRCLFESAKWKDTDLCNSMLQMTFSVVVFL